MMRSVNSTQQSVILPPTGIAEVISSIGEDMFGSQLLSFLYQTCGAEHCSVLRLDAEALSKVASASLDGTDAANRQAALYLEDQRWQRDPMMAMARQQLGAQPCSMLHTAISDLPDNDFRQLVYGSRDICDRLLLCGRSKEGIVALSVLRTRAIGAFEQTNIDRLHDFAATLLAIVGKHVGLSWQKPDLSLSLTSLEEIESCIAAGPSALPRRESEVCARILYGVSSEGIGLELGISEETVMTYRKRAYQRLGIASQRELLLWYIDLWNTRYMRAAGQSMN